MCGRMTMFDIDAIQSFLERYYQTDTHHLEIKPHYNIAPKQNVLSIVYDGETFRVGYISWGMMIQTKDKAFFNINAKKESLQTYSYFKSLYQHKRILVILNGYYEWQDQGDHKIPYYIYPEDEKPLVIAALYDKVGGQFGVTLMTQTPNDTLKNIHHRMPVILSPEESILYLTKGHIPSETKEILQYHHVSHQVNLTKVDHYDLIKPMDAFID